MMLRKIITLLMSRNLICGISSTRFLSKHFERKAKNFALRVRLATAYRGLNMYGLNEGICNHLSALAPSVKSEENVMLIIPHGLHWSKVTPSLLIGVNKSNEVVEGNGRPETTAICIHQGIYSHRPDVKCVMHTHMPYAAALNCLENPELLMIHQNSARFLNQISYDLKYGGVGDTSAEGKRLATALGDKSVLFMANHGAMTVSHSVAIAFDNMYYLERASMVQVLAYSTRHPLKELAPRTVELTNEQMMKCLNDYAEGHLGSILHKLKSECSDFDEN